MYRPPTASQSSIQFDENHHIERNEPNHVLEVVQDDRDWREKVPGLRVANFANHHIGKLSTYYPRKGPYVWSPGDKLIHIMDRNPLTAAAATFGSLTNVGRHNVPAGHLGISEDNGKLVLLGPGNHWLISPNHKYFNNVSIGQPTSVNQPYVIIRDQIMILYVNEGEIALVKLKGQYIRCLEGIHVIEGQNPQYEGSRMLSQRVIELGNVQIITVAAGEIGFAYDAQGNLLKLEAGKHVLQRPDRTFAPYSAASPFVSLSERLIRKRPYLRVRVEGNEVCVISDQNGEFQLLGTGVHEYFDPNVTLKDYLPLCQRNLAITQKKFKTSDNADVKTSFDVYFDIYEPANTIKSLCDPEKCKDRGDLLARISEWVKEKAIDAMAAVIVHYQSTDIAVIPDVKGIESTHHHHHEEDRIQAIRKEFLVRLSKSLSSVGIKLDSINLSSGLQIISEEAKRRVEGLIGAGAKEQLMMAEQRASLVKVDTEKQLAEIRAQIEQQVANINAETQQNLLIANAQANQKAIQIEAQTEALAIKAKLNVLIQSLGLERAFEFIQTEQQVAVTRSTFGNAKTIITGNADPSGALVSPLLMNPQIVNNQK